MSRAVLIGALVPKSTVLRSDLGHSALFGKNICKSDSGSGALRFICRRATESSNKPPVLFVLAQLVQSPELWPIPTRRTVLN